MTRGGGGMTNLIILSCILRLNLGPMLMLGPDTWRFEQWPLLLLLLLLNHTTRGRGEIILIKSVFKFVASLEHIPHGAVAGAR